MPGTVDWTNLGYQGSPEYTQARIGIEQGQAQIMQAQAKKQQMEVAQQQQFNVMLQGMANGNSAPEGQGDMPTQLDRLAQMALNGGLVDKAQSLANQSAAIRLKQAQTAHQYASTQGAKAASEVKNLDFVSRLLGNVHDQASWQLANDLYSMQTGQPSPYANVPYSPELVRQLSDASMSGKDRIMASVAQQRLRLTEADTQSKIDYRNFRKQFSVQQEADRVRRQAVINKSGSPVPQSKEISAAEDLVRKDYPDIDDAALTDAGFATASRAAAIRKSNPGLDASQALQRAHQELKVSGAYKLQEDAAKWSNLGGLTAGKHTVFKNPPPVAAQRVVGGVYEVNGKQYRWDGGSWSDVDDEDNSNDEESNDGQ